MKPKLPITLYEVEDFPKTVLRKTNVNNPLSVARVWANAPSRSSLGCRNVYMSLLPITLSFTFSPSLLFFLFLSIIVISLALPLRVALLLCVSTSDLFIFTWIYLSMIFSR